jgi:aspartokinase
VTDARHGDAAVLAVERHRVRRLLSEGTVPVVAGFQGAPSTAT